MRKNKVILIIFLPILVILCIGGVFLSKKLSSVSPNPPGTVGNTTGNLQNNGLFCESDGVVYFANPYDNNSLYRMNLDETNIKQVNTSMVKFINAGSDYLYYYQYDSAASSEYGFISNLGGIFRSSKNGGRTKTIKKTTVGSLVLVDDLLYYLNYDKEKGYTLYSIDTNRKNDHEIIEAITDPSSYSNGKLYYCNQSSTQNRNLFCYDFNAKTETPFLQKDVWFPQVVGNYLYYLDVHNEYALCRAELASKTEQVLSTERIDCYNVAGNYIYYQVNSKESPYLGKMNIDGTGQSVVTYGNYTNINATSKYIYFSSYGDALSIYHVPIGSTQSSPFSAAREAVMNKK